MKGYTLIEILIVLFIVSIVSSVAILSFTHHQNKELKNFANDFTQTLSLVEEQALLQPSVLGLKLNKSRMRFFVLEPAMSEKDIKWRLLEDYNHAIPDNIELNLEIAKSNVNLQSEDNDPQIIISTNGDITPFKLYIGTRNAKPRYVIIGDADGSLSTQDLS